jgi:hypothetical protein
MRLRVLYQRDDVRVEITGREAEKVEALVSERAQHSRGGT